MMFLRSFARPVLLAWLLVFALILAGPASVYARVEMLNGRDGVEGDPDDGADAVGSGGGSRDPLNKDYVGSSKPSIIEPYYIGSLFVFIPGYVNPVCLSFDNYKSIISSGGGE